MIAFEVEVVLDGYWEKRPPENVKAGILADWADTLQDWTAEQVVWALRKWRDDNPNKRPNPSHIRSLMLERRGQRIAAEVAATKPAPSPAKERVSREVAADILSQAGYAPKTFGSSKREAE